MDLHNLPKDVFKPVSNSFEEFHNLPKDVFKPVSNSFEEREGEPKVSKWTWDDFKVGDTYTFAFPNEPKVGNTHTFTFSNEPIETSLRLYRKDCADQFRIDYKFDRGEKTCVWSSSGICSWPDNKCYDALWVGVHGMDSICMVVRHKDLDMRRPGSFYKRYCTNEQTIRSLTETVISEIEGLPYDDKLREKSGQSIAKPFAVFSIPGSKKVHDESGLEASSVQYDEEKAIEYLREKMKSGSAFTYDETVQTAVSAFQHLCGGGQELKAEDFWVCAWKETGSKHLPCNQRKELVAVINGVSTNIASGREGSVNIASGSEGLTNIASGSEGSTNIATGGNGGGKKHILELYKKVAHYYVDKPCSCCFCDKSFYLKYKK